MKSGKSKDQISEYLEFTKTAGSTAKESTALLKETLDAIRNQTEALNGSIANLPSRLDQLETKVIDATKVLGEKTRSSFSSTTTTVSLDSSVVDRFLKFAPLSCNLLVYACVLAEQTGKNLSIAEFNKAIDTKLDAYMNGYMACMDSIDLIDREAVGNQIRVFAVKEVHPRLKENARSFFVDYINRQFKSDREKLQKWTEALTNLEAVFGVTST